VLPHSFRTWGFPKTFGEGETKVDIKTTLKASVAASAILAVTAPVAHAGNVSDGGSNKVVMSGKIVRGLMYADSGPQDEWFQGDGGTSGSSIKWAWKGDINENVSVSATVSLNFPHENDLSNATFDAQLGETVGTDNAFDVSQQDIRFAHKAMGSLDIGYGSMASNGRSESDYSGVAAAFGPGAIGSASAIPFFNNTNLTYSTKTASGVFSSRDGLSKLDRIRYNLPSFNGLNLAISTSLGDGGGVWDVGGSYTAMVGDVKSIVQAQVNNSNQATSDGGWSMSAALEHPAGASIQGFFGTLDNNVVGEDDKNSFGVTVGYKASLIAAGKTAFAVGYLNSQDNVTEGDDAEAWMVGAQQSLGSGVTVHASYRNVELDDTSATTDFDDITSFFVGTRVTF
jgi:hypothetical protein